jgi:hypothetical protein
MKIVGMNLEAMEVAVVACMGLNGLQFMRHPYETLDNHEAYVTLKLREDFERDARVLADIAEQQGYNDGFDDGEELGLEEWEEGYLDGVRDARRNPFLADTTVQHILSQRADEEHEEVATAAAALDDTFAFDAGVPVA